MYKGREEGGGRTRRVGREGGEEREDHARVIGNED